MEKIIPSWVSEAAKLPVAFAQVREDPLLDDWVVTKLDPGARILMIASGGCTLAFLAARGRGRESMSWIPTRPRSPWHA